MFLLHAGREVSTAGDAFFVAFARAPMTLSPPLPRRSARSPPIRLPGGVADPGADRHSRGSPTLWQDDYVGMDVTGALGSAQPVMAGRCC